MPPSWGLQCMWWIHYVMLCMSLEARHDCLCKALFHGAGLVYSSSIHFHELGGGHACMIITLSSPETFLLKAVE